jgi:hypothetical protein
MIEAAANAILQADHNDPETPPPTVGPKWLQRWLLRHPQYKRRRFRAIEVDRKHAENRPLLSQWFKELEEVILKYGIAPEDIWNFDETGFMIGIGKDQWVITRDIKTEKPYIGINSEREYVTVVEAVNAVGQHAPPLIICAGKCILRGWFDITDINDFAVGVSESGYLDDRLAFQWIQQFWRDTKKYRKGAYQLIICDGYGSHCTKEFVEFCEQQKMILFFLPPHTSHILQPLDVGVFHAFKHWHSEFVVDATYSGCENITKTDFFHAIGQIRYKTLKKRTKRHGFRDTGIWPFNPEVVLCNIPEFARLETPQSSSDNSIASTPRTAARFRSLGNRLRAIQDLQRKSRADLEAVIRGGEQLAAYVETMEVELRRFTQGARDRADRIAASRRHLRKGGIISSEEVNNMKRVELKIDEEKENKRWRMRYRGVMVGLMDDLIRRGIAVKRQRRSRQVAEE